MIILDGKTLSKYLNNELEKNIFDLHSKPRLSIILVGNRPDSLVYVNMKKKKCQELGIEINVYQLDDISIYFSIITLIDSLNKNKNIHGIMVQLPLPEHLKPYQRQIIDTIDPFKDVDGLTTSSLGKLITHGSFDLDTSNFFISSTVYGIIKLLNHYKIDLIGKTVGIIGNSSLVGMPLSIILSNLGATVDICHIHTKELKNHLIDKDIVVSCCGVKGLVKGDMVKEGVIIIDVGINVEMVDGKKKIFGDCEKDSISEKASMMTPVPGGVGPMTICSLLEQVYKSYNMSKKFQNNLGNKSAEEQKIFYNINKCQIEIILTL